jgi:hypothetical protein
MTRSIVVSFEGREDGGLTAYSDDIPGFVMSHADPSTVLKEVKPALEAILSCWLEEPVVVEEFPIQDLKRIPNKWLYLACAA